MATKKQRNLRRLAIEFLKYNIAGNGLFWSSYGFFFLFDTVLALSFPVAKLGSSLLGNIINFLLEKYWVFGSGNGQRRSGVEIFRYVSFMIMNFLIEYLIVYYLMVWFGISPYIGPFISGIFFWLWMYFGFKLWVFRSGKPNRRGNANGTAAKQKAARTA